MTPPQSITLTLDIRHALAKRPDQHKYDHGHALILSGGVGHGGAARLAARGALRIGAGLVTIGCPPAAVIENAAQLTAIMLRPVKDAEGFAAAMEDRRISALCLGPGLGRERARTLVPVVLATRRSTVLDADALSAIVDDPERLFAALHPNCVLTPHAGEFARVFPGISLPPDKGPGGLPEQIAAVREASARAGCVILLKGAETVIASPDGTTSIHSASDQRAAPWLATAGSGDVLAGFITGLLARGLTALRAAEIGTLLHAEAALEFGPGLIAEDLPEILPQVFRRLGL